MFRKLFPEVRENERQRFGFFLQLAALLLTSQAVAMTACESLLLSRLGVSALPTGVLLASAMTLVASTLYGRCIGKLRHENLLLWILGIAVVVVASSFPLVRAGERWGFLILFAFHCVTFVLFTTHFDTLASDYFDALAAKRILPLLGVGATLGEIAGGLGASALTRFISIESLLLVWIGLLVVAGLYLFFSRGRLRAWNPAPVAVRAVRSSAKSHSMVGAMKRFSLGRWIALSTVATVGAMSVVQYVASDVFARSFPEEQQLAAFLGAFLAVTNLAELVVGARVAPWVIRRLGVGQTNLNHPLGAVLTLGLLQLNYALVPAMLAWINRKMVHDALARPVKAMLYNAFPSHLRGGLRGFIQGVVGSAARALASFGLVLAQAHYKGPDFLGLGLVMAVGALWAAWAVRAHYLETLVTGLAEGRLNLDPGMESLGQDLEKRWKSTLQQPEQENLERLLALLVQAGQWELVGQGLENEQEWVRLSCLRALGQRVPEKALEDPAAAVRLEAARLLWRRPKLLEGLLQDPDPAVRELAQAATGQMDPGELTPELIPFTHADFLPSVVERLDGSGLQGRAAALTRLQGESAVSLRRVARELENSSGEVALAALELLASSSDPLAGVLLARGLADSRAVVRARSSALLGQRGQAVLPHLEPYLRAAQESTVESAYDAVALTNCERGRVLLGQELRLQIRRGWRSLFVGKMVEQQLPEAAFLRLALFDDAAQAQRLAYRVLARLEGERLVVPVLNTLRVSSSSARASALEVLSNLGDRDAAGLLVLLTERSIPLEERLEVAARTVPELARVPRDQTELMALCAQYPGRYVRLAALGSAPVQARRLCELHASPLFSKLSLEQLEEVLAGLVSERFAAGEEILTRDQSCDRFYFLQQGELSHPGEIFGEVSALDGGPVLETVVARTDCRFWTLEVEQLQSLVRRYPGLAFPLFQRLSRKLKQASA